MLWLETSLKYIISLIGLSESSEIWWEVFSAKFLFSVSELLILFIIILFIVQFLMTFINPEQLKEKINNVSPLSAHIFAAVFGAVTPFCTCSGVPVFAGLIKTGIPAGVAFSFLITSPLVNTIALAGLWTIFGAKTAVLYVIFGLCAGVIGGIVLSWFKVDDLLIRNTSQDQSTCCGSSNTKSDLVACCSSQPNSLSPVSMSKINDFMVDNSCCSVSAPAKRNRFQESWRETISIIYPVIPYLLIGSAIGIGITMGFSEESIASFVNYNPLVSVPAAIVIGAPLYSSTISVLPIIAGLYEKGLGIGVSFALLMSIGGMSFPEWSLLAGMMKRKLLLLFIGITGFLILIISYMFSILQFLKFL
ncbi:MAG: permease [Brevinemataceae bacterium]